MRQALHRLGLSLLAMTMYAGTLMAQNIGISSTEFPKAMANTSQPVKFIIHNYDFKNAVKTTGKVGIKQGDEVLCESTVDIDMPKMGNQEVQLPIRLHTDYGQSYSYTVYVDVEGNTNTAATEATVSFTMPVTTAFPVAWSSDAVGTSIIGTGNYQYFAEPDMYVVQGKVSAFAKGSVETLPVTFTKGQLVMGSFMHYSDVATTLKVEVDYGERTETVLTEECAASTKLTEHHFSFTADSTAIVRISGTGHGSFNTYGQLQLGRLSIENAAPDLAVEAITAPAVYKLATCDDGYEVRMRVTNMSPIDITAPTFSYSFGTDPSASVTEQYDGTIKAYESVDYAFKKRLDTKVSGDAKLTVEAVAEGDTKTVNNSASADITLYEPVAFPYTTGFDSGNDLWTTYDGNADGLTWGFESDDTFGNIVYFPSAALASDDYLFTPAVKLPKGRSRISFYYSGGRMLTQHLRLLMGTEPSADKMTEVMFDEDVKNNGWLNGYHVIDMAEEGVRYFAFQTTGRSDQIIIDNVKIDQAEDLCIKDVAFGETSGFGKSTSKVTLSYINHGVSTQKNITLRYYISTPENPYADGAEPYAEETMTGEVQPGETATYTFSKLADISAPGTTYTLVGAIATPVGDDRQNDMIVGGSVESWKYPDIPYEQGFEDVTTAQKQWTFANAGTSKWQIGNNTAGAYAGSKVLVHSGKVADGMEDWAFSEPLNLKKGTYDLSFFYRTSKNNATDKYRQSMRAMLGTAPTAEGMTTELLKQDDFLVAGQRSKKFTTTLTVDENGIYYLGFGNTTSNTMGMTFVDNIAVSEHEDGAALPLTVDFDADNAEDGLTKYYPSSSLPQWKLTEQDDNSKAEVVERTETFSVMSYGSEGWLVMPKLQAQPGKDITVTFDYALTCDKSPDMTLDVFGGVVNNPDEFTNYAQLPVVADGAFTQASVTIPGVAEPTNYFVAFRTSAPEEGKDMTNGYVYTAKIKNVSVAYGAVNGIKEVNDGDAEAVVLNGNTVTTTAQTVSIYDLSGRLVASAKAAKGNASVDITGLHGVFVVKAGSSVVKISR